ncbi:MAG: FtsX-like permease family protein, partial [Wenzhouxiangellaceae bacterium]
MVNGKGFEIIGVAPPGFVGLNRFSPADVFLPLTRVADLGGWEITPRNSYWMYLFTRVSGQSSAVRVEQALDRGYRRIVEALDAPLLEGVSDDWRQRFLSRPLELVAAPAGMSNAHDMARTPLILMLGVTALVLLVACVNIANLLLAVALSDRGETAVRMALGAGRRQIMVRQLLQLGILALIGALACIPVALVTLRLVLGILPG